MWEIERKLRGEGYNLIAGVDEAGRGPVAGPVFAAAVILPFEVDLPNLSDSKKLSPKMREILYEDILRLATSYAVASSNVSEIEEHNILNATFFAMNRAISKLDIQPEISMIDGNLNSKILTKSICIVKGDSKSASIAAASILAKVSRDRYMGEISMKYSNYGFDVHKGYGTKKHFDAIAKFGLSDMHRKSFLKKFIAGNLSSNEK